MSRRSLPLPLASSRESGFSLGSRPGTLILIYSGKAKFWLILPGSGPRAQEACGFHLAHSFMFPSQFWVHGSVYLVFKLDKFHLTLLCVWSKDMSKKKLLEPSGLQNTLASLVSSGVCNAFRSIFGSFLGKTKTQVYDYTLPLK